MYLNAIPGVCPIVLPSGKDQPVHIRGFILNFTSNCHMDIGLPNDIRC